jgi:hypothetical protein
MNIKIGISVGNLPQDGAASPVQTALDIFQLSRETNT